MIPVRQYRDFWKYIAEEIDIIECVHMVDDESELSQKIKDFEDRHTYLVVVTPSADLVADNEDNHGDIDTCVIYVLMKIDPRDETSGDIMFERESTQNTMKSVRTMMLELENGQGSDQYYSDEKYRAASDLMKQIVRGKQHVDRERNYLGCNGYSLSFGIKTNGF